jgi:hypothetical protein
MPEQPRRPKPAPQPLDGRADAAPPEAVRAVAALLGRVAAPRRIEGNPDVESSAAAATAQPVPEAPGSRRRRNPDASAEPIEPDTSDDRARLAADLVRLEGGDREIPIDGLDARFRELSHEERRKAGRRLRRARRAVREALERLSAVPADELGG